MAEYLSQKHDRVNAMLIDESARSRVMARTQVAIWYIDWDVDVILFKFVFWLEADYWLNGLRYHAYEVLHNNSYLWPNNVEVDTYINDLRKPLFNDFAIDFITLVGEWFLDR